MSDDRCQALGRRLLDLAAEASSGPDARPVTAFDIGTLRDAGDVDAADLAQVVHAASRALHARAESAREAKWTRLREAHADALADPEQSVAVRSRDEAERWRVVRHTRVSVWLAGDAHDVKGTAVRLKSGYLGTGYYSPRIDWTQPCPRAPLEAAAAAGNREALEEMKRRTEGVSDV
ncbi:MAG: hypothetical protein Q8Q14_04700 [Gemmatimonadales bacterium]|nr:hypothetical protein [Gemmatimonadales bacterium]